MLLWKEDCPALSSMDVEGVLPGAPGQRTVAMVMRTGRMMCWLGPGFTGGTEAVLFKGPYQTLAGLETQATSTMNTDCCTPLSGALE